MFNRYIVAVVCLFTVCSAQQAYNEDSARLMGHCLSGTKKVYVRFAQEGAVKDSGIDYEVKRRVRNALKSENIGWEELPVDDLDILVRIARKASPEDVVLRVVFESTPTSVSGETVFLNQVRFVVAETASTARHPDKEHSVLTYYHNMVGVSNQFNKEAQVSEFALLLSDEFVRAYKANN